MPDELVDYLRSQRDQYTREVLTQRAIEAGHGVWQVEAAWMTIDAEDTRPRAPEVLATFWAFMVFVAYAIAIAPALYYGLVPAAMYGPPEDRRFILLIYSAGMAVAGVGSILLLRRAPRRSRAMVSVGAAIAVSVVAWIGLSGLCVATLFAPAS